MANIMLDDKDNIIGFYGSFNMDDVANATFRNYIWGENGLANKLNSLKYSSYSDDIHLILFQFYVKPIPYLRESLKEIGNYRRKEKSIGISVIVDDNNFFKLDENGRYNFFRETLLNKIDLLSKKIKRNKLTLDIEKLKNDIMRHLN